MLQAVNINDGGTLRPIYEMPGGEWVAPSAPYIFADTLAAGYTQVTPVDRAASLFLSLPEQIPTVPDASVFRRCDYKFKRDYIKGLVNDLPGGFSDLTMQQRDVICPLNIGTPSEQNAHYNASGLSTEERLAIGENYNAAVYAARLARNSAGVGVTHVLTGHLMTSLGVTAPTYIIGKLDIETAGVGEKSGNLLDLFVNLGVQGIAGGDKITGVLDALKETLGTRYSPITGGGLRTDLILNAAGTPSGFASWADFADFLYDIYQNGNY